MLFVGPTAGAVAQAQLAFSDLLNPPPPGSGGAGTAPTSSSVHTDSAVAAALAAAAAAQEGDGQRTVEGRVCLPATQAALELAEQRCRPHALNADGEDRFPASAVGSVTVKRDTFEVLFRCAPEDLARAETWLLEPFGWAQRGMQLTAGVGLFL